MTPDDERMVLDVLDYSMGGMSVFSKAQFSVGDTLLLEMLTTLDGEEKPLGLHGEVKHVQDHDNNGYVIGMEFKK